MEIKTVTNFPFTEGDIYQSDDGIETASFANIQGKWIPVLLSHLDKKIEDYKYEIDTEIIRTVYIIKSIKLQNDE